MPKLNPLTLLKLWGVLTVIVITAALVNLLSDHFNFMILSTAVMMTIVFVYEWICYRVDGPSYAKAFDDERLTQVSYYTLRNSSLYFFVSIWLLAIALSKKPGGIKLIGSAENRRKASEEEISFLKNKTKPLKMLKGYNTIFGNLSYVRDIKFTDYFMINTGKMTFTI